MGSKSDPQNSNLAKIKKFAEALIPFLILIAYTLVISGVYYAIEINHCNINNRPLLLGQSSAGELQNFWQALHYVVMIESTIGKQWTRETTTTRDQLISAIMDRTDQFSV